MNQNKPQELNLDQIMAEIEEKVEQKKQSGFYNPVEIQKVEETAVNFIQPADGGAEAELNLHHSKLQEFWDAKVCAVETHRPGGLGRLLLKFKKMFHKASGFPLGVWLARQVLFNDEVVKLLNVLVPHHVDLRHRANRDERRLDSVEDLGRALTEQNRRLEGELAKMQAAIDDLTRRASQGGNRQELLLARLQEIVEKQAEAGTVSQETVEAVATQRSKSRGQDYLAFEDLHRGTREEIKKRQEIYLPVFRENVTDEHPLLDIGCGRGEFLELAKEAGLKAAGVDMNPEMAAFCQEMGLEVKEADALEYLRQVPDASLGGIIASQVIEHLTLNQLMELVSLCVAKLAKGGALVAETINPQCLSTFSGAFYLDMTHQKPIHPEAARFLWSKAGLGQVDLLFLSPYPPEARLESFGADDQGLAGAFNRNTHRLNQLLYSYQDYAVVGRK
ncbi:class I SAM-dependent methyltransferase [Dethiosulfatarculus sandiegensis]|uniref:WbbD domain-containing protein n=1 Tax=Dethiosulfatarculus sandiegensis TaxID=1429043 RepID=A0A0D2GFD3_9BACT|nr:class I SAM-dependent methyltransferase [Dethiosulfatarculus sandiegensis]KIX13637.1 WbbD domain-containing protein [Dethiosulfatarculus sandiegensis]